MDAVSAQPCNMISVFSTILDQLRMLDLLLLFSCLFWKVPWSHVSVLRLEEFCDCLGGFCDSLLEAGSDGASRMQETELLKFRNV